MSEKQLLLQSISYMDKVVGDLVDVDWSGDTTCAPWTLRELLNHVTYEWLWARDLLIGKTISEVGDKYEGDVLGEEPLEAYKKSSDRFKAVIESVDDKAKIGLSYGVVPVSEYMFQLSVEAFVHGWDIAKSSGGNTYLPQKETQELYDLAKKHEKDIESAGVYVKKLRFQKVMTLNLNY